jgi:hypothetical protein
VRDDFLEDYMKDPDKRAKLYLYFAGAMILSTVLIVVGTIVFILRLLGIV